MKTATAILLNDLYLEWSKLTTVRTEMETQLEIQNQELSEDCAVFSVRMEELSGIIKKLRLEVESLTVKEFKVGDPVLIYSYFQFGAKYQFGTVSNFGVISERVEVTLTQPAGNYRVGYVGVFHPEQLRHE